jgi:hypothetical protein
MYAVCDQNVPVMGIHRNNQNLSHLTGIIEQLQISWMTDIHRRKGGID